MGVAEVEAFLSHLAGDERVAASPQNQALSALLFLHREALHQDLEPAKPCAPKSQMPPHRLHPRRGAAMPQTDVGCTN